MPHSSALPTLELDGDEHNTDGNAIVPISGKLPHSLEVTTGKLLDVVLAFAPQSQHLDNRQKKAFRKTLGQKLYLKSRPGFYYEVSKDLHIAYAGQPNGAGTQHLWRLFCTPQLHAQIETVIRGTSLTVASNSSDTPHAQQGNYTKEWGGLYLRSEAEVRIAEALERTGLLFFANVRGRVGLQHTMVSNEQLSGRVELDFMICHQGRCMILEVDGKHHLAQGQSIRDYARDRVLLRSGIPTVRFTAADCLISPDKVIAEFLSILLPEQTKPA